MPRQMLCAQCHQEGEMTPTIETLKFSVADKHYEVDLCDGHIEALTDLAWPVSAPTKTEKTSPTTTRTRFDSDLTEAERNRRVDWLVSKKLRTAKQLGAVNKEHHNKWVAAGKP